jgi:hypothetical protein
LKKFLSTKSNALQAPTVGFDKHSFDIQGSQYSICELGSSMQANQLKFVNKARAIIYLVDCHNQITLAQSAQDLAIVLEFIDNYLEDSQDNIQMPE